MKNQIPWIISLNTSFLNTVLDLCSVERTILLYSYQVRVSTRNSCSHVFCGFVMNVLNLIRGLKTNGTMRDENLYHMVHDITMESQNSDSRECASVCGRSENFMNYVTLE